MRKLAKVVEIDSIDPIQNADQIEVATIGGWKVVVKKGEFTVGSKAIYIEIDAFLPEGNPLWQFLVDKSSRVFNEVKGHALKTIKLRGQISQGLILPLTEDYPLDIDLTEILGIVKYEKPLSGELSSMAKGSFPILIPKTDQERIQNLTGKWDELKTKQYEVTEKLEGSSMTVYLIDGVFGVCSRNLDLLKDENNPFWQAAIAHDLEDKMRKVLGDNIAIQGELIGEKIQGNYYGLTGRNFHAFDIYDIQKGQYISPESRRYLCKFMGVDHAPVLWESLSIKPIFPHGTFQDQLKELMDACDYGYSEINSKKKREGFVFKSTSSSGDRTSFKIISNAYLLGENNV